MTKEIVYNKLVRDKILEVIQLSGKSCTYHLADNEEYLQKLYGKLFEEIEEFKTEPTAEEAADILEVLAHLFSSHGILTCDIESSRKNKMEKRGGFNARIILEKVIE